MIDQGRLIQRAREERLNAARALTPRAREARLEVAECYEDLADAMERMNQRIAHERRSPFAAAHPYHG